MKIEEKYEIGNGHLRLNHNLFIKSASNEKNEDNLKNLFCLCDEINKWKDYFLLNMYMYFSQKL
jgi:hypothetical protein